MSKKRRKVSQQVTAQKISLSPRLQFEAYVHQLASDRSSPLEIHVSLNDMNNTYDVDYNYGRLLGWTPRIASANAIVAMHISVKKCIRSRCVDCPSRSFINALLQITHGASFANNAVSVNSLSQLMLIVVWYEVSRYLRGLRTYDISTSRSHSDAGIALLAIPNEPTHASDIQGKNFRPKAHRVATTGLHAALRPPHGAFARSVSSDTSAARQPPLGRRLLVSPLLVVA